MPFLHIFILALVQGITEFLPVSSSGHLILAHAFLNGGHAAAWEEDLVIDLAVHVGTLMAVLVYFRADVMKMLAGIKNMGRKKSGDAHARLNIFILVSSVPVLVAGFALHMLKPDWLRTVEITAWCTLVYGILLWVADKRSSALRKMEDLTLRDAVVIGLAQALSMIPGTSRSGVTMTAARFLGFSRVESARYSLLLAIVATTAAGAVGVLDLIRISSMELTANAALAAFLSFLAGFAAIAFMMRWLQRYSFAPFAIYRVILALGLLGMIYAGALA